MGLFCSKVKLNNYDDIIAKSTYLMITFQAKMVRTYKKALGSRRYKNYTEETLDAAVRAVKFRGLSTHAAAEVFNIPQRTIYNKVKNRHPQNVGTPTVLSLAEERHFVDLLVAAAEYGSPLTMLDLRVIVKNYLNSCGRTEKKFEDNIPGKDWCYLFLNRHKRLLSQRMCQNIKVVRAQTTEEAMTDYFERLARNLKDVPPENILNYDETNLTDDPGRSKCIFKRGTKYPERIMNSTKTSISVMFAGTAAGEIFPPYVVYKAERLYDQWCIGGPPNTRYNRTKSGWFDAATFSDWFEKMVIPWARRLEGPKAIIGDNLSCHLNINILQHCQRLRIKFIFLPPNTTHITQPLDVGFFRSLKGTWRALLTEYKTKNPKESAVNKTSFPALLTKLLEKMDHKNRTILRNAFKEAGICPLDKTQIIKKLPKTKVEDHMDSTGRRIDQAVVHYLEQKRNALTGPPQKKRKKTLKVPPGDSITQNDLLDINQAGPSSVKQVRSKKEKTSKIPILDVDEESLSTGELDSDEEGETVDYEDTRDETEELEGEDKYEEQQTNEHKSVNASDFVVVKFATKKTVKHFIGLVLEENPDGYQIKFLRKKRGTLFVFPDVDDISDVVETDIEKVLMPPQIVRKVHHFQDDLTIFSL